MPMILLGLALLHDLLAEQDAINRETQMRQTRIEAALRQTMPAVSPEAATATTTNEVELPHGQSESQLPSSYYRKTREIGSRSIAYLKMRL